MAITPEQQAKIDLVRLLVGDTPESIFYPMLTDEQYFAILELENWNVMRAARRAAISIAFQLARTNSRERTGDIEVWNNSYSEYRKVLELLINDSGAFNLPAGLRPYAGGISKEEMCKLLSDPDVVRSPLTQISPCVAWWTRLDRDCCYPNGSKFGVRL